jgi:hypothetical protein
VWRIGVLTVAPLESAMPLLRNFHEGLRDLGYIQGRNIILERRSAGGRLDKLPELAAELVPLGVDLIVARQPADRVAEMCELLREVFPRHESEVWVYGDASGRGRPAQTGQSDYTVILQTMKTYPVPLRLKVPEANPLVSMRVNAVNRLLRDEHGQVRVLIDPSCHELITDLEQVLRDGQKIKKTSRRSDPYFRRTHVSDALGYALSYDAPPVSPGAPYRPRITSVPLPGYATTVPQRPR